MTGRDATDRIELRGMRFSARHGLLPEEMREPQPFEVDIVLHADLRRAGVADDLSATTDYGRLYGIAAAVMAGPPRNLVEALAEEIAEAVMEGTDRGVVEAVEVTVRKPQAPMPGPFRTVGVTILRRRTDATGPASSPG